MHKLIINGDDFGRHALINEGIRDAFAKGILRSATLMATGAAFQDAVKIAMENPGLGVGIHLTLVNATPLSPPEEIPSLVTESGVFYDNYKAFFLRWFSGRISPEDVEKELFRQLEKVQNTGLNFTHLDSHQHLHHLPMIFDVTKKIAAAAKIKKIRIAKTGLFEGEFQGIFQFAGRLGLFTLAEIAAQKAKKYGLKYPDHFAGIVAGEALSANYLAGLIKNLPEGVTEVMLHPGTKDDILCRECAWNHGFEEELKAVTSPEILELLEDKNIQVANFGDL